MIQWLYQEYGTSRWVTTAADAVDNDAEVPFAIYFRDSDPETQDLVSQWVQVPI